MFQRIQQQGEVVAEVLNAVPVQAPWVETRAAEIWKMASITARFQTIQEDDFHTLKKFDFITAGFEHFFLAKHTLHA